MLIDKIKLEPDETIVIQTRRHWFFLVVTMLPVVLGAMIPFTAGPVSLWWLHSYGGPAYDSVILYGYEILFFVLVWLFFCWIAGFQIWTNYYLDILTVTDRRIILVNQKGLFHRTTASFRIERMQDITINIDGILPTLLDYGSLSLETAGHSEERFYASMLPHPRDLKALILEAVDKRM